MVYQSTLNRPSSLSNPTLLYHGGGGFEKIILDLAPPSLLKLVIAGAQKEYHLYLGVMFDVEESDVLYSQETGMLYVANTEERAEYCKLLRTSTDGKIQELCRKFTLERFLETKQKVKANPDFKGEVFTCTPGGLLCFSAPIVERVNNSFVGVVFGGQKLPSMSKKEIKK